MSNPNNCEMCDHKKRPDGGHCYMFRMSPTEPCMQHTIRVLASRASFQKTVISLMKKGNTP